MLDLIASHLGGVLVGMYVTRWIQRNRTTGLGNLAETELDIANVAFIRAAGDELDDETIRTLGERANEYCEDWDTPVRFDASEVSDQ